MTRRRSSFRFASPFALALATTACGPAAAPAPLPPVVRRPSASPPPPPTPTPRARFTVLPASASPITFARMAKFPEPGWQVPRDVAHAPDGSMVTWLESEDGSKTMSLFAFDRAKKSVGVLLREADLATPAEPRSREEELRRERQRERVEGITDYRWAKHAPVLVVPHGGDVYVRDDKGVILRLTKTPEPEIDPKPCATGARVAYVRSGELYAIDLATKHEERLTGLGEKPIDGVTRGTSDFNGQEELGEASGYWWSPRCDRVAYLEVDERGVGTVPVLGWRGGKPDLMMQRYPEAGGANPKVRLGVVDLATKRTTWMKAPRPDAERYLVDPVFREDGSALFVESIARDQKTREILRVDPKTGAATAIMSETSKAWVDPGGVWLLDVAGELLTTEIVDGHRHLVVHRQSDGARLRVITRGAWDVTRVLAVDEERGSVVFASTEAGVLQRQVYRVSLGGEGRSRERVTTARGDHDIYPDEHGRAWVDVDSAHDRLPAASLVVDGEPVATLPVHVDPDLADLRIRPPELVEVRGPSGDTLRGALLRPRALAPGEKHPAIVIVYGGPGVQTVEDAWGPRLFWQHLADRGFFVFQLDNRGSANRGAAFAQATYERLGEIELEDQLAGLAWLASQPGVDPARVGVYGHSYGGFMALEAMLKAPNAFAAGVSASPVTSWTLYDTGYTERFMGTPKENPEGYAASDLARFAGGLARPLLLVHGNMDENVHYANTARMVDAFVKADRRFEMLVIPGERHGVRDEATRAYAIERVVDFFVEHL